MNVILSEFSAGFAHYSWILCNELAVYVKHLTYLTEQKNDYVKQIDARVKINKLFFSFKEDKRYQKGSILWYFDRIVKPVRNCIRRNRYVKRKKPDIVLVQAVWSVIDCYFLEELKKHAKVALTVHDVIVPADSLSWNMKSLQKTYDISDRLIVHSETNKQQMMEYFGIAGNKISVVPHGIRSSYHKLDKAECRKQLGIGETENVFLFYGTIRSSKGLDILLEAMKGIPGILIIAGAPFYGESFSRYREIIRQNKIRTIEYIKHTEDSFRDILFQASDYIVLPYKKFYSQSGVFMEAIQFHIPIIASDVSSFREYIEKYDIGYICKPNDRNSLHYQLEYACTHKKSFEKQMFRAVQENSWEVAAKRYYEVFKDMVG